MKANELMIGDWVLYMGKPHYVIAIESDGMVKITTPENADKCRRATWPDRLEPIPLTPEILEKNGFVKSRIFVEWKHEKNGIYLLWKPFPWLQISTYNADVNFECIYVHQLQNALAICEIEKEITI